MSLAKSANEARDIWNGGACNPRAMARALVRSLDAGQEAGNLRGEAGAPARIILAQLCFILACSPNSLGDVESDNGDSSADLATCERLAREGGE